MWSRFINVLGSMMTMNKFFKNLNNVNNWIVNNMSKPISRMYDVNPLVLGDTLIKLRTTPIGNETKLNSSKLTLQSLEHPPYKNISHIEIAKYEV